jgi:hypothetical protein
MIGKSWCVHIWYVERRLLRSFAFEGRAHGVKVRYARRGGDQEKRTSWPFPRIRNRLASFTSAGSPRSLNSLPHNGQQTHHTSSVEKDLPLNIKFRPRPSLLFPTIIVYSRHGRHHPNRTLQRIKALRLIPQWLRRLLHIVIGLVE